ncbi:hypothetical protein Tco_0630161 [Tanacetum coccineum]
MAKNPVPFTHAKQVGFNLEDVILNTNNKVALFYPEHSNKEVFLSKSLDNSKVSFSIPTGRNYEVLRLNTFRKAIRAHYMSHSSDYVDPPSIDIVRLWFSIIRYGEEVSSKGTLKKSLLPPSVNNWAPKPNHTEGPPFTAHMLAICNAEMPVAFNAPRTSSQTEKKVSQGIKPGAKVGHKKQSNSSKQPPMSSNEATKGGSSKAPTDSKIGPSRKRKESSLAKDSNLSHPLVSTLIDTGMYKEDQQVAGGPTSLEVTSEERAQPQLSSGMSAFSILKLIYSASLIIHSESASRYDASANSTAEADPGTSAPNDSLPPQQDKTKSVSDGLKTVLTTPKIGTKNAAKLSKEIKFEETKLEDLAKLVPNVKADFKDRDSPEDEPIIVVDDREEDEEENKHEEIHSATNDKTKDISASIPPSLRSIQIQELTNQVLILQSQKHTLETEKTKAKAEIARLKAQHPSPNVEQLNELLVKSLTAKFSKILSVRDFHSSLPTKLKELPSKFNKLTDEVKALKTQVHGLEIDVPGI